MEITEQFKLGKKFIEGLKPSDKVILVHHKDADGTYSAAITASAFAKLNKKIHKIIPGTTEKSHEIIKSVKGYKKIIIVDIGIELLLADLNEMDAEILYIDHHLVPEKNIGSNITYINPRLFEPEIYQPATYVVYKFFSSITNISDKEWLAVIGTIGDYGFEDCRDLLDKYIKVNEKRDIWGTKYGKAAIITIGATAEIGFDELLNILVEAKNFDELVKNKNIVDGYKKYETLYEKDKETFVKNSESIGKLVFSAATYKLERVGSSIATETSTKNPDKIIFLLEKVDDFYKIHARYQKGGISLGELLRKMGIGGGHRQAAGGKIKITALKEFKNHLIKELKL